MEVTRNKANFSLGVECFFEEMTFKLRFANQSRAFKAGGKNTSNANTLKKKLFVCYRKKKKKEVCVAETQ